MRELKHQRIIANAGSGKTYRLTTRFIELLAREVAPEKIIALTFTRKAAGEFLDAIFRRLLSAATEEKAAQQLARDIGREELGCADFLRFLHLLIEKLPQLALGTLDGFFGRIIRVFPFECGLAGEITILEPHFQDVMRRTVLGHVFRSHGASEKSFRELLELLRQQSRNRQSRSVVATLDSEVRSLHEKFLLTPPGREWGDVDTIWPDGMKFPSLGNLSALLDEFESELFNRHPDMMDKHRDGWAERLEMLRKLRPGYDVPEKAVTFALRAIDPLGSKAPDSFDLKLVNKPFAFPNSLRPLVASLGRAILGIDLHSRIERSGALYHLLDKFEEAYQRNVRGVGRLTFLDITGLLAGGRPWGGRVLGAGLRQAVDYRLDASYDHWLLDEFQDTSRLQWQAVRDLIDEVVQSDSGQRSFFYVGDTKQAIYSWRGGDPRLFDEIAAYYNASSEERIDTKESLSTSYRSKPEILDGVNLLFDPDHLGSLAADMEFPPAVIDHWRSAWRAHQPSDPVTGQAVVSWQTFAVEEGTAGELLDLETARLLEEIQPGARGWTCAVLVHTNKRIASVVNALRSVGLAAAAEGRLFPCVDNELSASLLALVRLIAHPSDSLAEAHVRMSPLAALFHEEGLEPFRLHALSKIREYGLAETVRTWLPACRLDESPFLRHRSETFLEAASDFDESTSRAGTLDDFIEYATNYSVTESGVTGVIRVMTMHAAKGLDFDVVVLPEIQGVSLPSRRDDSSIHLHTGARGQIQWGLELPPKAVCQVDPVLGRAYEEDVVEDCYEKFCLYYVALTRAKRGLYLLSTRQGEDSKSRDFNRLLHLTFPDGNWSSGNPDWYFNSDPSKTSESQSLILPEVLSSLKNPSVKTPLRLQPSSSNRGPSHLPASVLLQQGAALGDEVHRALAQIEWLDETPTLDETLSEDGRALLAKFFRTSTASALFQRPVEPVRLWREKSFDVLIENQRIGGIFDRVVIYEDHAELIDFKTDDAAADEILKAHGDQLRIYRKSLAALLGWKEAQITARIVGVRLAIILDLDLPEDPARLSGQVVNAEQPDLFRLE